MTRPLASAERLAQSTLTNEEIATGLRDVCAEHGKKRWAHEAGVGVTSIDFILTGRRNPGKTVLAALGLRKVTTYETVNTNESRGE